MPARLSRVKVSARYSAADAAPVDPPAGGGTGRPSKSLSFDQAKRVVEASKGRGWIHPYLVLSVFTGVRTEEARALRWEHVHLDPPDGVVPHVEVWRSVRANGDTKTARSRRTLALPASVVTVLRAWREIQREERRRNGHEWKNIPYVFGTRHDTEKDPNNVIRAFNLVLDVAELPHEWTPRELRHTFVSIMSAAGAPDGLIADLVGHVDTSTTRRVDRHQLKPVITEGAEIMSAFLADQEVLEVP